MFKKEQEEVHKQTFLVLPPFSIFILQLNTKQFNTILLYIHVHRISTYIQLTYTHAGTDAYIHTFTFFLFALFLFHLSFFFPSIYSKSNNKSILDLVYRSRNLTVSIQYYHLESFSYPFNILILNNSWSNSEQIDLFTHNSILLMLAALICMWTSITQTAD